MKLFDFFKRKPDAEKNKSLPLKLPDGIELSPALRPYQSLIEKTALPYIRITATPLEDIALTQSKFGGIPFLPSGAEYPKDSKGNYMFLLAQLNFAEIPPLEDYPQKGLLQFFIGDNDLYGLDFDNPTAQKDFRVVYFEDYDEANRETAFDFLNARSEENMPVWKPLRLTFSKDMDYIGALDVRFEKNFGEDLYSFTERFGELQDEVGEELCDNLCNDGHKIGGYASFTQTDPRSYQQEYKDWLLLLQIDSQDNVIMWGDVGIGNFFIAPDDLKRKDFSSVYYNWDCC